ncbi:MAG: hypothetical protein EOP21_14610, partial [Hyphomicrobiales bacterium]
MSTLLMPDTTRRIWRKAAFRLYDAVAIALSLVIAVQLRMNGDVPPQMLAATLTSLPFFMASAIINFQIFGIYDRVWRLCSVADLTLLVEAATVAILVPVLALLITGHASWMPSSVPLIQWFVLIAILAAGRLWRRILADELRRFRAARNKAQPAK